jgi:hypothetical protein
MRVGASPGAEASDSGRDLKLELARVRAERDDALSRSDEVGHCVLQARQNLVQQLDKRERRRRIGGPSAILGGVVVFASSKLIDPTQWRDLARSSRVEVAIAAITVIMMIMVISVGVLSAIAVAVGLSILDVIRRAAAPADAVLGYDATEGRFADASTHPDAGVAAGVVVYRVQGRLFFANAHFFKRRVWAAVDATPKPVQHLVLDAAAETGLTNLIGADRFHPTVIGAVESCIAASPR